MRCAQRTGRQRAPSLIAHPTAAFRPRHAARRLLPEQNLLSTQPLDTALVRGFALLVLYGSYCANLVAMAAPSAAEAEWPGKFLSTTPAPAIDRRWYFAEEGKHFPASAHNHLTPTAAQHRTACRWSQTGPSGKDRHERHMARCRMRTRVTVAPKRASPRRAPPANSWRLTLETKSPNSPIHCPRGRGLRPSAFAAIAERMRSPPKQITQIPSTIPNVPRTANSTDAPTPSAPKTER